MSIISFQPYEQQKLKNLAILARKESLGEGKEKKVSKTLQQISKDPELKKKMNTQKNQVEAEVEVNNIELHKNAESETEKIIIEPAGSVELGGPE